jgi:hypothetical protein
MFRVRCYGGDRILIKDEMSRTHDLDIVSYDLDSSLVTARRSDGKILSLVLGNDGKSDEQLFQDTIVARWNELEPQYLQDPDLTDYYPALYASLKALDAGDLKVFKESQKGESARHDVRSKISHVIEKWICYISSGANSTHICKIQ